MLQNELLDIRCLLISMMVTAKQWVRVWGAADVSGGVEQHFVLVLEVPRCFVGLCVMKSIRFVEPRTITWYPSPRSAAYTPPGRLKIAAACIVVNN